MNGILGRRARGAPAPHDRPDTTAASGPVVTARDALERALLATAGSANEADAPVNVDLSSC